MSATTDTDVIPVSLTIARMIIRVSQALDSETAADSGFDSFQSHDVDYGNLAQIRDLGAVIFTVLVETVTPEIFTAPAVVASTARTSELSTGACSMGPRKFMGPIISARLICGMGRHNYMLRSSRSAAR